MTLIADILLIAGALGAGFYCLVLARRLNRFNDLGSGVGGAIAVLSAQVDDMTKALEAANAAAKTSAEGLEALTGRAEAVARRLELLVASMHDLPPQESPPRDSPARTASAAAPAPAGDQSDDLPGAATDPNPTASGPLPDSHDDAPSEGNAPTLFLSRRARIKEAAE